MDFPAGKRLQRKEKPPEFFAFQVTKDLLDANRGNTFLGGTSYGALAFSDVLLFDRDGEGIVCYAEIGSWVVLNERHEIVKVVSNLDDYQEMKCESQKRNETGSQ